MSFPTELKEKTSLFFTADLTIDGTAVDIRADSVSLIFKRYKWQSDEQAVLTVIADVATAGESGRAGFILTPADMAITPNEYVWEIKWISGSAEYIPVSGTVTVTERVWD